MLILNLTYKTGSEAADSQMEPHLAWVKDGYEKGWFLASGRKVPRTGGVILAKGDRADIEAFCRNDPFVIHDIATYDVIEMVVATTVPELTGLK